MSDLRQLYQELILDHSRHPRNNAAPQQANRHADGFNPLCGDRLTIHLRVADGKIEEVGFEGSGCAISTASASLMTDALKGLTVEQAHDLFDRFHRMVTGEPGSEPDSELGKLGVLSGVCEFPVRVKCATLAWHTFKAAVQEKGETVTTE